MIKLIRNIGYYHPSSANWSYGVHLVIDSPFSRLYKSTFGGESRFVAKLKEQGVTVDDIYLPDGAALYTWKAVKQMPDIENYQIINTQ